METTVPTGPPEGEPNNVTPPTRTVSVERLNDELRDLVRAAYSMAKPETRERVEAELAAAVAGIVLRVDDKPVTVLNTDRLPQRRNGADTLGRMMFQARSLVLGVDGGDDVELLMPTPDVLAALDGRATDLLTAPVQVLAMDITAGMLLHSADDDGDGAETLELVTAVDDCEDLDCVNGTASCVVLTVGGHEDPQVHFNGFSRTAVRIPVGPVTR